MLDIIIQDITKLIEDLKLIYPYEITESIREFIIRDNEDSFFAFEQEYIAKVGEKNIAKLTDKVHAYTGNIKLLNQYKLQVAEFADSHGYDDKRQLDILDQITVSFPELKDDILLVKLFFESIYTKTVDPASNYALCEIQIKLDKVKKYLYDDIQQVDTAFAVDAATPIFETITQIWEHQKRTVSEQKTRFLNLAGFQVNAVMNPIKNSSIYGKDANKFFGENMNQITHVNVACIFVDKATMELFEVYNALLKVMDKKEVNHHGTMTEVIEQLITASNIMRERVNAVDEKYFDKGLGAYRLDAVKGDITTHYDTVFKEITFEENWWKYCDDFKTLLKKINDDLSLGKSMGGLFSECAKFLDEDKNIVDIVNDRLALNTCINDHYIPGIEKDIQRWDTKYKFDYDTSTSLYANLQRLFTYQKGVLKDATTTMTNTMTANPLLNKKATKLKNIYEGKMTDKLRGKSPIRIENKKILTDITGENNSFQDVIEILKKRGFDTTNAASDAVILRTVKDKEQILKPDQVKTFKDNLEKEVLPQLNEINEEYATLFGEKTTLPSSNQIIDLDAKLSEYKTRFETKFLPELRKIPGNEADKFLKINLDDHTEIIGPLTNLNKSMNAVYDKLVDLNVDLTDFGIDKTSKQTFLQNTKADARRQAKEEAERIEAEKAKAKADAKAEAERKANIEKYNKRQIPDTSISGIKPIDRKGIKTKIQLAKEEADAKAEKTKKGGFVGGNSNLFLDEMAALRKRFEKFAKITGYPKKDIDLLFVQGNLKAQIETSTKALNKTLYGILDKSLQPKFIEVLSTSANATFKLGISTSYFDKNIATQIQKFTEFSREIDSCVSKIEDDIRIFDPEFKSKIDSTSLFSKLSSILAQHNENIKKHHNEIKKADGRTQYTELTFADLKVAVTRDRKNVLKTLLTEKNGNETDLTYLQNEKNILEFVALVNSPDVHRKSDVVFHGSKDLAISQFDALNTTLYDAYVLASREIFGTENPLDKPSTIMDTMALQNPIIDKIKQINAVIGNTDKVGITFTETYIFKTIPKMQKYIDDNVAAPVNLPGLFTFLTKMVDITEIMGKIFKVNTFDNTSLNDRVMKYAQFEDEVLDSIDIRNQLPKQENESLFVYLSRVDALNTELYDAYVHAFNEIFEPADKPSADKPAEIKETFALQKTIIDKIKIINRVTGEQMFL
jgi:hypothetical protein